jgi:hypothetical protein
LEERLGVFQESDVVSRDGFDQVFCGAKLTQGNSELNRELANVLFEGNWSCTGKGAAYVVGIVESVEKILVERMYI